MINYNVRMQGQLYPQPTEQFSSFRLVDVSWVGKADLGNYMINLQGGLKFDLFNYRMGYLQDYNPSLPTIMFNETSAEKKRWLRFNFFVEPDIRFAAYNATLEGLMFNDHSIYKIDHKDVNRILFEISGGLNVLLWDVVYLKYTLWGRSQEFSGGKSFHSWGGVTLGLSPAKWNKESLN